MNLKKTTHVLWKKAVNKSPQITIGFGIVGMWGAGVLAVKATPKALYLIEQERKELSKETGEGVNLGAKEIVAVTWKCYIPAATAAIISTGLLIGSNHLSTKRNAALATAYKLSETVVKEYKEYREKMKTEIGEEKEKTVRDEVITEKVAATQPLKSQNFMVISGEEILCFEYVSGRYFKSTKDKLNKAVNEINRQMLLENYVNLNDFYDELGLEHSQTGNELGWRIDDGYVELFFSSQLTEDGKPCLVVDYETPPKYNYSDFM